MGMANGLFPMSDIDKIPRLIELGSSSEGISKARKIAGKALSEFPHNGCAAYLSALLRLAGITEVPETLGAGKLAHILRGPGPGTRGWDVVSVGKQRAGDVGVTFDLGGNPGADHIYLVVAVSGADKMTISDNQESVTHTRYASGKGKTRTEYFLRAV